VRPISRRVQPSLIDDLQKTGVYGDSRGEIARNLILDHLKLIAKDRLLPEEPGR
jgi:hypothetical protein